MSGALLSIFLDVLVLVCLGVTIYYALKLSRSLNNFRKYRKEFDGLISELNKNIEEANIAMAKMKDSSHRSADDLEDVLQESRTLADELRLINETGDSLASRLESLAEKNRRIAQGLEDFDEDEEFYENVEPFAQREDEDEDMPFTIQDPDFTEGQESGADVDDLGDFQSQAEQELYQALQGGKKKPRKRSVS